jgi:5,10-methylene-tetrahydrofolate dehydrogenase/methenyl tetrahydrofolate cyclohydrolase
MDNRKLLFQKYRSQNIIRYRWDKECESTTDFIMIKKPLNEDLNYIKVIQYVSLERDH